MCDLQFFFTVQSKVATIHHSHHHKFWDFNIDFWDALGSRKIPIIINWHKRIHYAIILLLRNSFKILPENNVFVQSVLSVINYTVHP